MVSLFVSGTKKKTPLERDEGGERKLEEINQKKTPLPRKRDNMQYYCGRGTGDGLAADSLHFNGFIY